MADAAPQYRPVEVLLFGVLRARAGTDRLALELTEEATAGTLLAALGRRLELDPELLAGCRVAVDLAYCDANASLDPNAEIAVIPPVAGGRDEPEVWTELATSALDSAAVHRFIAHDAAGGNTVFTGTVRNHHDGRRVTALRYEVYDAMARRLLDRIARDAAGRFGLQRAAIVHRTGELAVGEVAVCVGAGAAHREETFTAVRWMMAQLKADVPIFKFERYGDGDSAWVRCRHPEPPIAEEVVQP